MIHMILKFSEFCRASDLKVSTSEVLDCMSQMELVDVMSDGVVKVRLTGACGGCPMATMTLKKGIERVLKEEVPEVTEVVAA